MRRFVRVCDEASAEGPSTGFVHVLVFALIWLLDPSAVLSQQNSMIRAITFSGNTGVDTRELHSWMTIRVGDQFSEANVDSSLKQLQDRYRQQGYPFAQVDSFSVLKEESTVALTIFLTEGKPAILRSLRFEGNGVFSSDKLLMEFSGEIGERFRPHQLEENLQTILQQYEKAGYPFARATLKDVAMKETTSEYDVEVVVSLEEGEPVLVTVLSVEGNRTTKEEVIAREARVRHGVRWTPELPARVQQRLLKMQIFSSVSLPELFVRKDGTAGLLVRVTEGNHNRMDGMIGYAPTGSGTGAGSIMGLVNLHFRNLFGTGRRLAARWYRENQFTQEIELRYHEPWIAAFPVNGDFGFFQRKQDSSYVRRQYDLSAELILSEEFRVGVSLSQTEVIPSERQAGRLVAESHSTTVGGYVLYDSRDDAVTPTSGMFYRTEFQTGTKKRSLGTVSLSNTAQRFTVEMEYTLAFAQRHLFNATLHARELRSGGLDISDLYRLGGATTLRGYREGQFFGSRLVWTNIEYRILVAPRSFFYLFSDVGYISNPDPSVAGLADSEQTKVGYGIGTRMDTALGLLGVSIALGQGDTFSTAKLHLRLVNEF